MGLVFAIANQKGGVGKTTTTMNLAGAYHDQGYRVLVADADSQQSCMSWAATAGEEQPLPFRVVSIGKLGKLIGKEISALANDYDSVVVDCPPNIEDLTTGRVLAVADATLVPTDVSPLEMWSNEGMLQLIEKMRTGVFAIFLNKSEPRSTLHAQMKAVLAESNIDVLEGTIRCREIYRQTAALGRTVFDAKGIRNVKIAKEKVIALYAEIVDLLQSHKTGSS